jgi:hypothetical protein
MSFSRVFEDAAEAFLSALPAGSREVDQFPHADHLVGLMRHQALPPEQTL